MDDVVVVKAAHHMDNGIGHADVAQKFVAQALSPTGPLHQAGDVHKLDDRRGGLFRVVHLGQPVQTGVGDGHHAHVGVDGAEGIVGALSTGVGDGVKQGALAHIGQTHDS
jgi:hypothetical protein